MASITYGIKGGELGKDNKRLSLRKKKRKAGRGTTSIVARGRNPSEEERGI